ncbi:MAG: hypothetical protein WCO09_04515, partial [bacterium]
FNQLPEFQKDFKRLAKKYQSLVEDLNKLERSISLNPTGTGNNFVIIHHNPNFKIIKTRMACRTLHDRSMRVVYAYHDDIATFVHIEIYYKGDKESEDRERIAEYIKSVSVN